MKDIQFTVVRESDDDTWIYTVSASREGLVAHGTGWTERTAKLRATDNLKLKEKSLSPTSPEWENTPESNLIKDSFSPDDLAEYNQNEAGDYRNE